MKAILATSILTCLLALPAISETDDYLQDYSGIDFPAALHFYLSLPPDFGFDHRDQIRDYSGAFEGESSFSGDRRYDPFTCRYKVEVKVQSARNVRIDWHCMFKASGGAEWIKEAPVMTITNAKVGSTLVWGDMSFKATDRKDRVTRPFIGIFVVRLADAVSGLLLLNRYEGWVFLPRHEVQR